MTSSAPHAPPGKKAPEQSAVVSCAPLQETNHPAARSIDLQPDIHGCPGKHGRQIWVRCGSGENTRGRSKRSKRSVRACPAERLLLSPSDLPERQPVVLCSSQRTEHGWRQRVPILSEGKARSQGSHAHTPTTGA